MVAAAVEPVPGGLARGRIDRARAAEGGQGGVAVQPLRVGAAGDQ